MSATPYENDSRPRELAELRAEVEKARNVIAGLVDDRATLRLAYESVTRERDEARAEVERLSQILHQWDAEHAELKAEVERLREALLQCARQAEALKKPCSDDPESAQAVRNARYQSISTTAHIALGTIQGPAIDAARKEGKE